MKGNFFKLFILTLCIVFSVCILFVGNEDYRIDSLIFLNERKNKLVKESDVNYDNITLVTSNNSNQNNTQSNGITADYIKFNVSKQNSLGTFAPNDLVTIDLSYSTRPIKVSKLIIDDLYKLINKARAEGVNLKVVSGYRSYSDQNFIFNNYVQNELKANPGITKEQAIEKANKYSAKPGHSEHQLGTTVDILSDETNYQFNSDPNTKYAKWLEKNVSNYKFRISYPLNNSEYIYEPWHIRWIPN